LGLALQATPDVTISPSVAQVPALPPGPLEPFAPGKSIGGDRFGSYERHLP